MSVSEWKPGDACEVRIRDSAGRSHGWTDATVCKHVSDAGRVLKGLVRIDRHGWCLEWPANDIRRPRKKPAKPTKRKRSTDDPERLAWVREQPCARCHMMPPSRMAWAKNGWVTERHCDAHHPTGAGMGLKTPDADAFPLCRGCHNALHALDRPFKGWTKDQLRRWQAGQVAVYQVLWERERDAWKGND